MRHCEEEKPRMCSIIRHCEEDFSLTWQSPINRNNEIFTVAVLLRNDRREYNTINRTQLFLYKQTT